MFCLVIGYRRGVLVYLDLQTGRRVDRPFQVLHRQLNYRALDRFLRGTDRRLVKEFNHRPTVFAGAFLKRNHHLFVVLPGQYSLAVNKRRPKLGPVGQVDAQLAFLALAKLQPHVRHCVGRTRQLGAELGTDHLRRHNLGNILVLGGDTQRRWLDGAVD